MSLTLDPRFKLVFKSAGLGWFRLKSAPMSSQHLSEMAHRISELILVHHHQHHHHKSGISLETGHGKIKQALVPLGFFTKRQYLGLKKNSPNHWQSSPVLPGSELALFLWFSNRAQFPGASLFSTTLLEMWSELRLYQKVTWNTAGYTGVTCSDDQSCLYWGRAVCSGKANKVELFL